MLPLLLAEERLLLLFLLFIHLVWFGSEMALAGAHYVDQAGSHYADQASLERAVILLFSPSPYWVYSMSQLSG